MENLEKLLDEKNLDKKQKREISKDIVFMLNDQKLDFLVLLYEFKKIEKKEKTLDNKIKKIQTIISIISQTKTDLIKKENFLETFNFLLNLIHEEDPLMGYLSRVLNLIYDRKKKERLNVFELLLNFFSEKFFDTTSFVQEIRYNMYNLIRKSLEESVNEEKDWLLENKNLVVNILIDQTEGEKDFRNMKPLFDIWDIILENIKAEDLQVYKEKLFDLFERYFPITTRKKHPSFLVDFVELAKRLVRILSHKILFEPFLEHIYSKMSEDDINELGELRVSLKCFYEICLENNIHPFLDFLKVAEVFEDKLRFFFLQSKTKETEYSFMLIYQDFIQFISTENKFENSFASLLCGKFLNKLLENGFHEENSKNSFLCLFLIENSVSVLSQNILEKFIPNMIEKLFIFSEKDNFEFYIIKLEKIFFRIFFHPKQRNFKIIFNKDNLDKIERLLKQQSKEKIIFLASFLNRYSKIDLNFSQIIQSFYFYNNIEDFSEKYDFLKTIEFLSFLIYFNINCKITIIIDLIISILNSIDNDLKFFHLEEIEKISIVFLNQQIDRNNSEKIVELIYNKKNKNYKKEVYDILMKFLTKLNFEVAKIGESNIIDDYQNEFILLNLNLKKIDFKDLERKPENFENEYYSQLIAIGINRDKINLEKTFVLQILKNEKTRENLIIVIKALFLQEIKNDYNELLIFFLKTDVRLFKKLIKSLLNMNEEKILEIPPLYNHKFLNYFERFILDFIKEFPQLKIFGNILNLEYIITLEIVKEEEISKKFEDLINEVYQNQEIEKQDLLLSILTLLADVMKKINFKKIDFIEILLSELSKNKLENKLLLKYLFFVLDVFDKKYFINKILILKIKNNLEEKLGHKKRIVRKIAAMCLNKMFTNYENIY